MIFHYYSIWQNNYQNKNQLYLDYNYYNNSVKKYAGDVPGLSKKVKNKNKKLKKFNEKKDQKEKKEK